MDLHLLNFQGIPDLEVLSGKVVPKLQESNNFMKDLERAAGLDKDLENPRQTVISEQFETSTRRAKGCRFQPDPIPL